MFFHRDSVFTIGHLGLLLFRWDETVTGKPKMTFS